MKKLSCTKLSCVVFGVCIALAINSPAQTVTTVASYNGWGASSPLTQGTNGNFYGEGNPGGIGSGNTYEVSPSGTMTSLATLSAPFGGLTLASNGFLYGTDQTGGTALMGSIFKMTSAGTAATIYSFCANTCDSSNPSTSLVQVGGVLYGTTPGTVFKITFGGALTTLYNFCNTIDCNRFGPPYPSALVQGSDGNFYGTTAGGNVNLGTVFKMTPSGTLTTLYTFSGPDGSSPSGSLVQGPNGAFYGMTVTGGNTNSNCPYQSTSTCGTIFKITPGGTLTTLHKFNASDGANPQGSLVLGTDGNFYGTTYQGGGSTSAGTIFKINPAGKLTSLYTFCQGWFCVDGSTPRTALMQATDGTFYGTTFNGGQQTLGVVFNLSMGLGRFVQTAPLSNSVGSNIIILGNGLTGSTSVKFNGTSAAFAVVSDTEITATVPSGATTGRVKVTTPSGMLTSNAVFRVIR
jgi:uncharacterized repeat protein (TIGR03803 family)